MAIVINDSGSWPLTTSVVYGPKSDCGGTIESYKRTTQRTAYRDTEYMDKKLRGLPLGFLPYSYSIVEYWDTPLPSAKVGSLWKCNGGIAVSFTGASQNEATTELLKKVADQEWNVAVTLGEMPETVKLISSTAKRLGGAMVQLKRGKVNNAFRALGIKDNVRLDHSRYKRFRSALPKPYKTARDHRRSLNDRYRRIKKKSEIEKFAASSWLELQYGWVPTLSDVRNAASQTARRLNDASHDVVASGYSIGSAKLNIASPTNTEAWLVDSEQKPYIIRREARYRVANPIFREMSAFGLTDPLTLAWELLPLSFVVDWFLPVGDYLKTFSANTGLEFVDGGFTTFKSGEAYGISKNQRYMAEGRVKIFSIVRSKVAGSPAPVVPALKFDMGLKRFTDAISLVRVIFGR